MGLSIGVKKGALIMVDGKELKVLNADDKQIVITFDKQQYTLSEFERFELQPAVWISMGKPTAGTVAKTQAVNDWDLLPRILFEAPRSVVIRRMKVRHGYETT